MSNITVIYVGNDNELEVAGLRNEMTGADMNNATVTVRLTTTAGVDVDGAAWPKTLPYVAGSNGLYRATLPYTLTLVPGGRYVATIVADAGAGLHAQWEMECVARARN